MYDFRKRITLCRLMRVIFSTIIQTGESPFTKPNSLFTFQTYTVADSKKNRSQFLRFGGGLRSQFLRFGGGLSSQFLRFGGGLMVWYLGVQYKDYIWLPILIFEKVVLQTHMVQKDFLAKYMYLVFFSWTQPLRCFFYDDLFHIVLRTSDQKKINYSQF